MFEEINYKNKISKNSITNKVADAYKLYNTKSF